MVAVAHMQNPPARQARAQALPKVVAVAFGEQQAPEVFVKLRVGVPA